MDKGKPDSTTAKAPSAHVKMKQDQAREASRPTIGDSEQISRDIKSLLALEESRMVETQEMQNARKRTYHETVSKPSEWTSPKRDRLGVKADVESLQVLERGTATKRATRSSRVGLVPATTTLVPIQHNFRRNEANQSISNLLSQRLDSGGVLHDRAPTTGQSIDNLYSQILNGESVKGHSAQNDTSNVDTEN